MGTNNRIGTIVEVNETKYEITLRNKADDYLLVNIDDKKDSMYVTERFLHRLEVNKEIDQYFKDNKKEGK
jgi:hypothetical protein